MITLEQVSLLETRVSKVIETLKALRAENAGLQAENRRLQQQLEGYEKRVTELERLVQQFKEDQGKIEATILSALARLNQFEDVLETELSKTTSPAEKKSEGVGIVPSSAAPSPQDERKGGNTSFASPVPGTGERPYSSPKLSNNDTEKEPQPIDEIDAALAAQEQAALEATRQKTTSFSSNELDIF
ncbi:MAG: cell division protein ZapB [Breznakiellaceae bacterium]